MARFWMQCQMLHYFAWLVLIPLIGARGVPWKIASVSLARRSAAWRRTLAIVLAVGGAMMLVLWAGFVVDYPLTRDIYFSVAILHVLAEVPFLLRLL